MSEIGLYCDQCKQSSAVDAIANEDAYSAMQRIIGAHRKLSPDCDAGGDQIRIDPFGRIDVAKEQPAESQPAQP